MKELYEGKVAMEAAGRAGQNPNLKGIVHEVIFKDKLNLQNILTSKSATLTSTINSIRDDVIVKEGGRIVGRMQLKDTVASIADTISRVREGQYGGTVLMGTEETVKAYVGGVSRNIKKGVEVTQKMTSTGISSADTARIGSKALGKMPVSEALIAGAKGASIEAGAINGCITAVCSLGDLVDGKINGAEYVGRVTKETVGGGIAAGVATIASSAAAAGTASVLATAGASALIGGTAAVAAPLVVGFGAAVVVGNVVKGLFDSIFG